MCLIFFAHNISIVLIVCDLTYVIYFLLYNDYLFVIVMVCCIISKSLMPLENSQVCIMYTIVLL